MQQPLFSDSEIFAKLSLLFDTHKFLFINIYFLYENVCGLMYKC